MTNNDPHRQPASIEKKFTSPPGVLPRNVQTWVIGGIALLMVLVIAISGSPPERDRTRPAPALPVLDPSQARIEEYQARIDEQARRLAAEQAAIEQSRHALDAPAEPRPAATPRRSSTSSKTRLQAEIERREYESRFASNITISHRGDAEFSRHDLPPPAETAGFGATPATAAASKISAGMPPPGSVNRDNLESSSTKRYRLFEGTFFETVLTNRLDGEFSGPVNCMVTTDVYSRNRRRVLIPAGSRVLGEARRVETFGQNRLAVAFHRLIMPDGLTVDLDQFQGLNQVGETGLRDKINRHYLQTFGVSLAIGAIAGLGQANTRYGFDASGADVYVQGAASSLSQSSLRILDRYLNVLPTHTIREGHRIKIYLSNDLLLPAYEDHRMPHDL